MLKRTHLAIGAAVGLYFLPRVNNKILFLPIVLIASLIPDIDSESSLMGDRLIAGPLHWFTEHRGVIHSYTLCITLSVLLAFLWPIAALPFFLGYSFHLLSDSFTVSGIRPFWPSKLTSKGVIRTGGRIERAILGVVVVVDVALLVALFI